MLLIAPRSTKLLLSLEQIRKTMVGKILEQLTSPMSSIEPESSPNSVVSSSSYCCPPFLDLHLRWWTFSLILVLHIHHLFRCTNLCLSVYHYYVILIVKTVVEGIFWTTNGYHSNFHDCQVCHQTYEISVHWSVISFGSCDQ